MSKILNFITEKITKNQYLYPIYKYIFNNKEYPNICMKDYDICLESYPSSANSFLYVAMRTSNSKLKICHHTHSIANIKKSLKFNIPIVTIIRKPSDCIASRIIRFKKDMGFCIQDYMNFYNFIIQNKEKVTVFKFEDIIYNVKGVLTKISTIYDLTFDIDEENYVKIVKNKIEINASKKDIKKIALPNEEREKKKKIIKEKIRSHNKYKSLLKTYQGILEICMSVK